LSQICALFISRNMPHLSDGTHSAVRKPADVKLLPPNPLE